MTRRPVVVIGAGRLGTAIAWAESKASSEVHLVARRAGLVLDAARAHGMQTHVLAQADPAALPADGSWFLCVSDAALGEVAHAWGKSLHDAGSTLRFVAHGSGVMALEPLLAVPAEARAVIHPMRALPAVPQDDALVGAPLSVLADSDSASDCAQGHVRRWQAVPLPIADGADRRRYHLACSLAANHVTGLLGWAEQLAQESLGPTGARQAVLALAESALARIAESGPGPALTGPLVRGEVTTLQAHLQALDTQGAQRYRAALRELLSAAQFSQRLDAEQAARLITLLDLPQDPDPEHQP